MRSFSLILLRRLLFRPATTRRPMLYDQLSAPGLSTLERILLHSLAHEPVSIVRRRAVDAVTDLANHARRPWHALQSQVFGMADAHDPVAREAAFRVFAGCPNLVMDLQAENVMGSFQKGLQDPQSTEVSPRCWSSVHLFAGVPVLASRWGGPGAMSACCPIGSKQCSDPTRSVYTRSSIAIYLTVAVCSSPGLVIAGPKLHAGARSTLMLVVHASTAIARLSGLRIEDSPHLFSPRRLSGMA